MQSKHPHSFDHKSFFLEKDKWFKFDIFLFFSFLFCSIRFIPRFRNKFNEFSKQKFPWNYGYDNSWTNKVDSINGFNENLYIFRKQIVSEAFTLVRYIQWLLIWLRRVSYSCVKKLNSQQFLINCCLVRVVMLYYAHVFTTKIKCLTNRRTKMNTKPTSITVAQDFFFHLLCGTFVWLLLKTQTLYLRLNFTTSRPFTFTFPCK